MSQGFAREARIGVDLHVGETLYYTANDTFAKADYDGLYGVKVKVQAGGGGGGGAPTTGAGQAACGGGGGSGGYAEKIIIAADLGTSETITVGAGGAGGVSGAIGTDGGASSFGSHAAANGGNGGSAGVATASGATLGVSGGTATAGDLLIDGSGSLGGFSVGANPRVSGMGGDAVLGGGGRSIATSNANGTSAGNYGGGGGGGLNGASQGTARDGGAGGVGIVIVEVLYERKIAVDEDIHDQYLNDTRHNNAHSVARYERASSTQSIAHNTVDTVVLNSVRFENDADGDFSLNASTGVVTFANAGTYALTASVRWQNIGALGSERRLIGFYVNGLAGTPITWHMNLNATSSEAVMATVWEFSASDTIELAAYQDHGSDITIVNDARTFMTIQRIA